MLKDKIQDVLDAAPTSSAQLAKAVNAAISDYYTDLESAAASDVLAGLRDETSRLDDLFGVPASKVSPAPPTSTPTTPAAPVYTTVPVVSTPPTQEPATPTDAAPVADPAAPVTVDTPSFPVGDTTTTGSDTTAGSVGYSAS